MIAYDHTITFVPKLTQMKPETNPCREVIEVKAHAPIDAKKQFPYLHRFFVSQGRNITLCSDTPFARTREGVVWGFDVEEIALFFWESGTKTLSYIPQKHFTEALLEYWVLHIVLPLFFTIEEKYDFIHAGAVEVEGRPILFVAESFGGKSTMTDYFLKQGHTLVSDDKVGSYEKEGTFMSVASIPFHRPYRKFEDLGYYFENISDTPKPIEAIYALHRSDTDANIEISELQGVEKFKALRYSSEYNLSFLKTKRFDTIARLAKAVPVYDVIVPWDIERLNEVYSAIVEHCKKESV